MTRLRRFASIAAVLVAAGSSIATSEVQEVPVPVSSFVDVDLPELALDPGGAPARFDFDVVVEDPLGILDKVSARATVTGAPTPDGPALALQFFADEDERRLDLVGAEVFTMAGLARDGTALGGEHPLPCVPDIDGECVLRVRVEARLDRSAEATEEPEGGDEAAAPELSLSLSFEAQGSAVGAVDPPTLQVERVDPRLSSP